MKKTKTLQRVPFICIARCILTKNLQHVHSWHALKNPMQRLINALNTEILMGDFVRWVFGWI